MTTWDDSQLVQKSADPEEQLFPILDRAEGFKALLFVLALIPGFMAITQSEITQDDAQFAIDSLSLFSDKSTVDSGLLPHALSGVTLLLPQFTLSKLLIMPTWLCGFLLVLALYLFGQTLLNSRCGYFAVLLFLFHPLWIEQLSSPVTPILATLLSLLCLWGYYRHLEQDSLFSPYLLVSILTAGLNLLTLPLVSLAVIVGILFETILFSVLKKILRTSVKVPRHENMLSNSARYRMVSWSVLTSVVVSLGLLFTVLGTKYKSGVMEDYGLLMQHLIQSDPDWSVWLEALWEAGSFQAGMLLLGGVIAIKHLSKGVLVSSKILVLVLMWVFFGFFWLETLPSEFFSTDLIQTFRLLFLCTSVCLIALGIDGIHLREATLKEILLLIFLGLVIGFGWPDRNPSSPKSISQWIIVLAIPFLFWQLIRYGSQQEKYQRRILQCCVILFLLFNTGVGWLSLQSNSYQAEPYDRFQAQTRAYNEIEICLVIGPSIHDPILQCLVEVNWLGAEVLYLENWNAALKILQSDSAIKTQQVLLLDSLQGGSSGIETTIPKWQHVSSSGTHQFPQFTLQCHHIKK